MIALLKSNFKIILVGFKQIASSAYSNKSYIKTSGTLSVFFYSVPSLLLASTWSLLSATFPMLIANYDASSNILPFGLAHFSLDAQVLRNANMWHAEFRTESRYRRRYPLATEKFTWAMFKQSFAFRQALPRICCNPSMKWKNGEKLLKGEL